MFYLNTNEKKKADFLCNAICYNLTTKQFTSLDLHSNPESSEVSWQLSDCLTDVKNKKLRTGGRLLVDYCSRPFHRIIKMYQRGFKFDLKDSDSMHYLKKVLSNDSTCPFNLNNYCWDLLYEVFFPLIEELINNAEYCYKLYFNQLLMDVLYDYDCQGISKIFKLKDPIYDDDIQQMLELSKIDDMILDSRFLNLKPKLFYLQGEQNPDLAEWIIDNIENTINPS